MLTYYYIIFIPIFIIIFQKFQTIDHIENKIWISFFIFLLILLGSRNEIGGDWFKYLQNYTTEENRVAFKKDLLNLNFENFDLFFFYFHFLSLLKFKIHFLYFTLSGLYLFGLYQYLKNLEFRWIGVLSSLPYLTIVVSTGYVKQSMAVSFIFFALFFLMRSKIKHMNLFILMASFCHISSLIFFLLNFFKIKTVSYKLSFLVLFILSFLLLLNFNDKMLHLIRQYVLYSDNYSSGYIYRLVLSLPYLFLSFFLLKINYFESNYNKIAIYNFFTYLTLLLFFMAILNVTYIYLLQGKEKFLSDYFIFFKMYNEMNCMQKEPCRFETFVNFEISTLIDRLNIYLMIIYPVIISDFFSYINHNAKIDNYFKVVTYLIFFIYIFFTLHIWINGATHSGYWVPYKSILYEYN